MKHTTLALLSWTTLSCVPDFDDRTSRVVSPRVLAVRATPAEAAKGEKVELSALIAGPDGALLPEPSFTLCLDRKPLSALSPVSPRCLAGPEPDPEVALGLGTGPSAVASLPAKVCQLFGPERPDPKAGEPSGRPVDPDPTGGFYQPIVAWLGDTAALGAVRLNCPLSGATREGTVEYNERYRPNQNPSLEGFELVRSDGSAEPLDGDEPPSLAPAERVGLRARFGACPVETPESCGGAERYVFYDRDSRRVVERVESLVVTWFSTDGVLDEERTEPASAEAPEAATNGFVAPARSSEVTLWAVVRDDRGGVTFRSGRVRIE